MHINLLPQMILHLGEMPFTTHLQNPNSLITALNLTIYDSVKLLKDFVTDRWTIRGPLGYAFFIFLKLIKISQNIISNHNQKFILLILPAIIHQALLNFLPFIQEINQRYDIFKSRAITYLWPTYDFAQKISVPQIA